VDLWYGLDQTLEWFGLCFACGLVDFLMDYVIMMDFIIDYVVMMDFCEL
jgi:hypothetical protein